MYERELAEIPDRERVVLAALLNPKWTLRTAVGIAKETHIPEPEVEEVLARYSKLVRVSALPDRCGRPLYAFQASPISGAEKLAVWQFFLSKSL